MCHEVLYGSPKGVVTALYEIFIHLHQLTLSSMLDIDHWSSTMVPSLRRDLLSQWNGRREVHSVSCAIWARLAHFICIEKINLFRASHVICYMLQPLSDRGAGVA